MNNFAFAKFFFYLAVFCVPIVVITTLFPFIVGKYAWFRISVDISLIFLLVGLILNDKGEVFLKRIYWIFKQPIVIAMSVFVVIFLLACFFGVDPTISFWSNFERGEGGLQIIHLYVFFLLLISLFKEEKDWRWLFISTLIGGLGMTLYGVLAGINVKDFIGPRFDIANYRFQGSIGNPAYVAAYAIFMLFYSAYILISKYGKKLFSSFGAWVFWFLFALFLAVFFAAATRGAFLGLVAAGIVFVSYIIFRSRRWRKWFLGMAVLILILAAILIQFKNTAFIKSLPISRLFELSFSVKSFSDRAIMWQIAIDGWKARPIFGWGPENFIKIFDQHFGTGYFKPSEGFGAWFDRAHSIYFDYLAETGILGLLSLLGIWIVFYWQFLKTRMNTDKNTDGHGLNKYRLESIRVNQFSYLRESVLIKALIFSLPVAYLIQGIVLFDVLPIYMNVFLFLAFAVYKFSDKFQVLNSNSIKSKN